MKRVKNMVKGNNNDKAREQSIRKGLQWNNIQTQ